MELNILSGSKIKLDFQLKVCYNMDIITTLFRALSILK